MEYLAWDGIVLCVILAGSDKKFWDIWVYRLLLKGSFEKLGKYYLIRAELVWVTGQLNMWSKWCWYDGTEDSLEWIDEWGYDSGLI